MKEITEENMDGSNKKTHYVLGSSNTETKTSSSNFSGYNFGKKPSTTDSENNTNTSSNG